MKGRLNAYKTTMMGRPIMKKTAPVYVPRIHTTTEQPKPKPVYPGPMALWQWLTRYCK